MNKRILSLTIFLLCLFTLTPAFAQSDKGGISGAVKDSAGAVLQGAKIELQPQFRPITTDGQGEFNLNEVAPGTYTVTVSYVGFAPYTGSVTVVAGQIATIDVVLKVNNASDEVIVTADRPRGEAEAINRTLAAENILQVLPAEVIVSLPNANVADALGRMASVTIERDEGEGKYVQIRGTEPRLSNTMIDGVTVPSPESGVRQIKLDTIPSGLVESVEINKTLQANIDGDGIGGSVNLVTKTAGEEPTVSLDGIGGYTPIRGGRSVNALNGTLGKRFGGEKRLGILLGGAYDYNGRAIDDTEPTPTPGDTTPHYDGQDFRVYTYDRTRWGLSGSADYKLNEGSNISLRGLFSNFRNWGYDMINTLNDYGNPQASQSWRRPNMAIGSVVLQGRHIFNASTILWSIAAARARSLGGYGGANYSWAGDPNIANTCFNDQSVATSVYRPGWSTGCYGTGTANALDRNNYAVSRFTLPTSGQSVELNLQALAAYSRMYHFGSRFGTVEFGAKIRNAHKFDDTFTQKFTPLVAGSILVAAHPEWDSDYTDPNYYDKTYKVGTLTNWSKVENFVLSNQELFTFNLPAVNSNNYDLIERVPAGYVMNTIELASRVRLVTGLRIEATHVDTLSYDGSLATPPTSLTFKNGGDYLDLLPSASLRFALDKDSDLRLVYGRGLSRPNPQDITAAVGVPDDTVNPHTVSMGNPALKAEHANNYDVLYERNFRHLGLLQAGYFYKDLSDPITTTQTIPTTGPFAGYKVTQPGNAGSGHVQGVEISYQQRLSYLPGVLSGAGIAANYSYTSSKADGIPGRSDSPALLRDAPNSWNFGPTYDTRHFSMRFGMTYDDAMIYAYQWQDGADSVGIKGPSGDNYLYSHFQMDTQASYKLPWGIEVYGYGLNLNNEVFGFFNGSPKYVVQREYYHPTFAGGVRWTLNREGR